MIVEKLHVKPLCLWLAEQVKAVIESGRVFSWEDLAQLVDRVDCVKLRSKEV